MYTGQLKRIGFYWYLVGLIENMLPPPFQKILRFIAFYSDVQSLMHPFLLSDLQHNPFIMRYSPRAAFRVIEKERIDLFHNLLFYCPTPRATLSVLIRLRHLLRTGEGKRKMVVWRGKW